MKAMAFPASGSPAVGQYGPPCSTPGSITGICAVSVCLCLRLFSDSGWAWGLGYQCRPRPVWQKGPLVGNLGSSMHNKPGQNILRSELSSASFLPGLVPPLLHRSQTCTVVGKLSWPTPAPCPYPSQKSELLINLSYA